MEPLYDSNYRRQNFGARGRFNASSVNGEKIIGWLLVSLPLNEMTNKTLAELFKIYNSS